MKRNDLQFTHVLVPRPILACLKELPEEYNKSGLIRKWVIEGFYADRRMNDLFIKTGRIAKREPLLVES